MPKLGIDRSIAGCYKHVRECVWEMDNDVHNPRRDEDNDVLLVHEGSEGRFFLPACWQAELRYDARGDVVEVREPRH